MGTELSRVDDDAAYWRGLVGSVRGVFRGRLTYAANWDDLDQTWLDAVDVIGVDAWIPLTTSDNPSEAELVSGWDLPKAALHAVHARWDKPVLLTEIGYGARTAAARQPWRPGRREHRASGRGRPGRLPLARLAAVAGRRVLVGLAGDRGLAQRLLDPRAPGRGRPAPLARP